MTALEAIAQANSVAVYRDAERRLERRAWIESRKGNPIATLTAARLAHHVGVERLRCARGSAPDEWERSA